MSTFSISAKLPNLDQKHLIKSDSFSQALNTKKDKKPNGNIKTATTTKPSSAIKNFTPFSNCTYTYIEIETDSGKLEDFKLDQDRQNDILPEVRISGPGRLRLKIYPNPKFISTDPVPKNYFEVTTSDNSLGQEFNPKLHSFANVDPGKSIMALLLKFRIKKPFNKNDQHFTVDASCSRFDSQGKYLGRQKAKRKALPPEPKLVNHCFLGIWPCLEW